MSAPKTRASPGTPAEGMANPGGGTATRRGGGGPGIVGLALGAVVGGGGGTAGAGPVAWVRWI
jgi:hypothetical protein